MRWGCLVATMLLLGTVGGAVAAGAAPTEDRGTPKANSPAEPPREDQEGQDLAYQGEYGGFYGAWGHGPEVGLQVISRGEGRFDGVLYGGGLPGAAWDGATRSELSGTLDGAKLTLANDGTRVTIAPGDAGIFDSSGRRIASLIAVKRVSRTLGARPPHGATVLFDGGGLDHFKEGAKATEGGLLVEGAETKVPVGDFYMHLEFQLPFMPAANGQGRGNSGVYIQRRYEVQILDSFGLKGAANECGALYRQTPPDVNMCLPPLAWQTYDIFFRAARWNATGEKIANARLTLLHNGVAVHRDREIPTKTGNGKAESPEPLPILFQDHRDPVRFRNIWMTGLAPEPEPQFLPPPWCPPPVRFSWCLE